MLFDWKKKPPPVVEEAYPLNPFADRRCRACEHVGRPKRTWPYRIVLLGTLLFFSLAFWVLPWTNYGMRGANKITAAFLFACIGPYLFLNPDGFRCAKCGGILW